MRLLSAVVVLMFGANLAFAVPMIASDIIYPQTEITHFAQPDDVGFAARAPPLAVTNVATTGGVTVMQGSAFALHGQETVVALFGFDADHIATNNAGADNVATYNPLKAELTAEEIAQGHAWSKHGYEFEDLGITERHQFQFHVEDVINNPSDVRYYGDGRTVYIDSETRTVVIRNPDAGESTAFRPPEIDYDDYVSSLPTRTEPYQ